VLERVGQRLLDDAVRGQVHASREIDLRTVHRERDVQTRRPRLVHEPRNVRKAGLWTHILDVGFWSEYSEQVAQLIERLASRRLHRVHRLRGGLRVVGGNRLGGACLHRHQAHPVGDDVVELACDPGSLLGNRSARFGRLFPFELGCTLAPDPEPPAGVPHEDRQEETRPDLRHRHRVAEGTDRHERERASQCDVAPPVVAGVAADAVQREHHGDPDRFGVAESRGRHRGPGPDPF
jgi:hypothetical protein